MKVQKGIIYLVAMVIMSSCIDDKETKSKYEITTKDIINDSTVLYSCWIDTLNADCFIISKSDTVERYYFSKNKYYSNASYFNNKGNIYRIEQFLSIANESRLNESIYFFDNGRINEDESMFIKSEILTDSIKLFPVPFKHFNKIRVIISENKDFNVDKWIVSDTIESFESHITIPTSIGNKKCLLQVIKTDEFGRDESGRDLYIDIDNLKCRDMKKSLICNNPSVEI